MPNKIKAALILGTAALIIIIAAIVSLMQNNTAAFRVVKLSEVKGSAVVLHGKRETEAYAGMNLESKDSITVGKDSSVCLLLDNDTYVILDSETTVTLEATGSSDNSITDIRLISGTVLNEICSPLSEKSSYTVSAPGMSMKVRGTSFSVSCFKYSEEAYLTELNTYHGSVAVSLFDENGNPKGSEIYVDEGKTVTVITEGSDPVNKGSASFIYPTGDGENPFYYCSEEDDPTYLSSYFYIPSSVRERVLASDANKRITLSDDVRDRLSGIMPPDSLVTTAPPAETQPDETTSPAESSSAPDDTVINSDTEDNTEEETEAEAETEEIEENEDEQPAETTRPAFTLSPVAVFTTVAGPSPSAYTTTTAQMTTVPISLTVITTTTEDQGEFEIEYITETAAHTTTYEQPEDDAQTTDPWYLRPTVTTTEYVSEIPVTTTKKPVTTASTTFRQVTNPTTTTWNITEPVTTEVTTVSETTEAPTQTEVTEPVTVPTTASSAETAPSSAETTPSAEPAPDPVPDPTAPPAE